MNRLIVALAIAAAIPACKGCGPVVTDDRPPPEIHFLAPLDGATITRADDTSVAVDGIQIDVRVQVAGADPLEEVALTVDGVTVNALVGEGEVTFEKIRVPIGEVALDASVRNAGTAVTINVLDEGFLCDFIAPEDGDVLGSDADVDAMKDGMQADLTIGCNGLTGSTGLSVGVKGRRLQPATLDAFGRATIPAVDLAEGPNTLVINETSAAVQKEITVIVDTGRCLAELLPSEADTILYDSLIDGPAGTTGPKRRLTFTTSCADGSTATLALSGGIFDPNAPSCSNAATSQVTATVSNGVAVFDDVTLYQGEVVAVASVVEAGSTRVGRALDNHYQVDTVPPRIALVFPSDGALIEAGADDPMLPGFQTLVRAQIVGVEEGTEQTVVSATSFDTAVASKATSTLVPPVPDCFDQSQTLGAVEWPAVEMFDGEVNVELTIADASGNSVTKSVTYFVATQTPSIAITSPAYSAGPPEVIPFLTLQDDADAMTPGLQADFTVQLTGVPAPSGRPGSISVDGQLPTFFSFAGPQATVRVSLDDGPPPSNVIDPVAATVTLQGGMLLRSPAVKLQVDATPPVLNAMVPRDGDVILTTTTPITVALESELQDRQVRAIIGNTTITETIPAAATAGDPLVHTFSTQLSLAAGSNMVRIEADDRSGAKKNTTSLLLSVYRVSGPPTIAFTSANGVTALPSPPAVLQLGPQDFDSDVADGFDVRAAAHVTAAPGAALVSLFVTPLAASAPVPADLWLTTTRTIAANGQLDVSDLDFSLWVNEDVSLWLQVTESATGASAAMPARLNVRAEPASANDAKVAITAPGYDSRTNSAAFTVAIATDASLSGTSKTCTLALDGSDLGGQTSTFSANTASFTGTLPALADGSSHTYFVHCTAPGLAFFSQRVPFVFRSVAPVLAFVDATGVRLTAPSGPYYFNALATDTLPTAGYQHDVSVSAAGEPDGTIITLRKDGVVAASGPIFAGVARFRDVTLSTNAKPAAETITLAAELADAFGFGTLSVSRSVLLDLIPPTVAFANGACPDTIARFNPFDDAGSLLSIEWSAGLVTSGVPNGGSVVTTVTHPSGVVSSTGTVNNDAATADIAFPIGTPAQGYDAGFVSVVKDAADNTGSSPVCVTTIDPGTASVSIRTQREDLVDVPIGQTPATHLINLLDDQNMSLAGIQTTFVVTILNIASGSTVRLCTTATDAALTNAPACTKVPGKVLATAITPSGNGAITQVSLADVRLVDSGPTPYGLAVEVEDPQHAFTTAPAQPMGTPNRVFPVRVDSQPPSAVVSLTSPRNIVANDRSAPATLVLGKRVWRSTPGIYDDEGDTSIGGRLDPGSFTFTLSGSTAGFTNATLTSDLQALSAAHMFSGNSIVFTSLGGLVEGLHTLTLTTTNASGNVRVTTWNVLVDVTLPTVVVAAPTQSPYTCAVPGTCSAPGGRNVDVDVGVSDTSSLLGGCGCARRASDPQCAFVFGSCAAPATLAMGTADLITLATPLSEGSNAIVAEAMDAAGNVGTAASVAYDVDTLATFGAPSFEMSLTPGSCASFGAKCTLAFDTGPNACRDPYPSPGTAVSPGAPPPSCARWYSSNTYRVGTSGTTGPACALGTNCTHAIKLRATPLDGAGNAIGSARDVFLSDHALAADVAAGTLLEALPPSQPPGLDRSSEWQLVLEATDPYGNVNVSAPRFASLPSFAGALMEIDKAFGGTGPITSTTLLGIRHNKNGVNAPYTTDLAVAITWVGTPPAANPRCVQLTADTTVLASTSTHATAGSEVVTFANVPLPDGGPFSLDAKVFPTAACSGQEYARVTVNNVRTTRTAPTVQFECAWRSGLGFGNCGQAPVTVIGAAPSGPTGALVDADTATAGFQFAAPPKVTVANADGGTVSIATNLGLPLTGITSLAVVASGTLTFDDSLTVPTSMTPGTPATTNTHTLTATVCNAAGDCATTPVNEALLLKANADPPARVGTTTVCTGETTGPFADVSACTALCTPSLCDRRAGKAVISFTAPGANAGSVSRVSGYDVAVAIIDETPSGSVDARCDEIVSTGTAQRSNLYVPVIVQGAIATAGATQVLAIQRMPIHQRVCVAALAKDDVGNHSQPRSSARVNALTPVSTATQTFARTSGDAERPVEDAFAMSTLDVASPVGAITVGDMDGDGGVEIAIAGRDTGTNKESVFIYSSKRTRAGTYTAREVITAPPSVSFSPGFGFGSLAGGDFNGDGFADIAIGDAYANAPDGSSGGGAVYVYYGSGDTVSADPALIKLAACGLGNVPSPLCPHVILTAPAGHFLGWGMTSGRVSSTTAFDLLVGDLQFGTTDGGVYLARTSSAVFAASGTTQVFDLTASPAGVTRFQNTAAETVGGSIAVADLNGDGTGDIAIGDDESYLGGAAHKIYFYDGSSLPATPTELNAARCDLVAAPADLRSLNLTGVGKISNAGADWLMARIRDGIVQSFTGSAGFFTASATCVEATTRVDTVQLRAQVGASPPTGVQYALLPVKRFGASLDDGCNTPTATLDALTEDVFGTVFGAAPAGDFDGDGTADFLIGLSGNLAGGSLASRALVVSYATPICGGPQKRFRIIAELTGNASGSGPGLFVLNAGNHAGGTFPALGMVGNNANVTKTLLLIFR